MKEDEPRVFYVPEAASISNLKALIEQADLNLPITELLLISGADSGILEDSQEIGRVKPELEVDIL